MLSERKSELSNRIGGCNISQMDIFYIVWVLKWPKGLCTKSVMSHENEELNINCMH